MFRIRSTSLVAGMAAAMLCQASHGSIIDYQAAVQSNGTLLHHYTFDGIGTQDSAGSAHLGEITYGTGQNVSIVSGFDGSSMAMNSKRVGGDGNNANNPAGTSGAYYRSTTNIALPNAITVEAIFRADATSLSGQFGVGYITTVRDDDDRGLFLMLGSATHSDNRLGSMIGNFNNSNYKTIQNPVSVGDWLYVAMTFEVNTDGPTTTINGYIANLSAGDATVTSLGSTQVSGRYAANSPLSLGGNPAFDESGFPGLIDEVAIYGSILSQSQIQAHLDAVLIPEPASLALVGMGAMVLMRRRRPIR